MFTFDRILFFGMPALPILFLATIAWLKPAVPQRKEADGTATCILGSCWLLKNSGINIELLPLSQPMEVKMGDMLVTTKKGSQLLTLLNKGRGELKVSDIAIITVGVGRKQLEMNNPKHEENAQAGIAENASQVMYLGQLPIKVLSPERGGRIILTSVPGTIQFQFSTTTVIEEQRFHEFSEWVLQLEVADGKSEDSKLSLTATNTPEGTVFSSTVSLPKAGKYHLIPANLAASQAKEQTVSFEVVLGDKLEGEIKNLIQGMDSNKDNSIEIRSH